MADMIELVAKRMWERTHDGTWPEDAESDASYPTNARGEVVKFTTANIYRGDARAAIEAMRVTESMVDAAMKALPLAGDSYIEPGEMRVVLQAAIDTALKEKGK